MATSMTIKQHDLKPPFVATLEATVNGVTGPVDLSLADEVRLLISDPKTGNLIVDSVVDSADSSGNVSYQWQSGDTATAGTFKGEVQVLWGTKPQTFPNDSYFQVIVKKDLGP